MLTWQSAVSRFAILKRKALSRRIANLRFHLRSAAEQSCRYSERQFKIFGAIAVFLIPATAAIEQSVADAEFNTFFVRALAGLAGLPILFHRRLPANLRANIDIIWVSGVAFVLPFCYGLILTINSALADVGSQPSQIWVYQYIVALFIFVQLTNNAVLSFCLWILTSVLIFMILMLIESPNNDALKEAWLFPLPVYLTALIIGSISNRNMHIVKAEQLRAASAIGSNIAHELRTPLASIRLLARATGRMVPDLVEGHRAASSAGLKVPHVEERKLEQLHEVLTSIQSEVDYSNTIIDMLLFNASENSFTPGDFEIFPISVAIEDAVARFPFNNSQERTLLSYSIEEDFEVSAPRLFIVHVLFNIIKNGLYYVQSSGKGTLSIQPKVVRDQHMVIITDTGPGIPRRLQHQIFERFFSTIRHGQGAGIGLSFCKMVMESIGGEIECESMEGEYTTFRLIFPPID
jgi:two-component system, CAI-1 autoinducer sensor kinase/phosphatase CqsS